MSHNNVKKKGFLKNTAATSACRTYQKFCVYAWCNNGTSTCWVALNWGSSMSPRQSPSDCVVKLNCRSVVHNSSVNKSVWLFSHRPDITTLGVKHPFTYLLTVWPPTPSTPTPNNRVPTNFSIRESRDKEQTAPFGGVYLQNLYVVFCQTE